MSNKTNCKLCDIIESFVPGDWGNESCSDDTNDNVFCVRGADIVPILNNDFTKIPTRYISNKSLNEKKLKAGDIVIEKSGGSPVQSTGRAVFITEKLIEEKSSIVCSNFCVAIRIKNTWNPKFVFYYWQHLYNSGVFFNFEGKTSGIKNLQLNNALQAITIPDYPLSLQKNISDVISIIDRKIALNREINRNLEALARQLYDYWFVQFDFPDENGRPYKSSGGKMVWNDKIKREIPEGWEVVNLFNAIDVQYGFPFSTDLFVDEITSIPVVRIRDILNGTVSAYSTEETDPKYRIAKGDVLIGMDGNFHMNLWCDDEAYLNQRSVRFRQIEGSPISALQVMFEVTPYIKAKEQNAKGSTVGHLSDKDLRGLWIMKPTIHNLFSPATTLKQISNLIVENRVEIQNLTRQRDELLPLLMNGQVSVMPSKVNCDLSLD